MTDEERDEACVHDWQPFWDGSLGYGETDRCAHCGDYRATPDGPLGETEETAR